MVANVRESLAVFKKAAQIFEGVKFNIRKVNELDVRKQYQIDITDRIRLILQTSLRLWRTEVMTSP